MGNIFTSCIIKSACDEPNNDDSNNVVVFTPISNCFPCKEDIWDYVEQRKDTMHVDAQNFFLRIAQGALYRDEHERRRKIILERHAMRNIKEEPVSPQIKTIGDDNSSLHNNDTFGDRGRW